MELHGSSLLVRYYNLVSFEDMYLCGGKSIGLCLLIFQLVTFSIARLIHLLGVAFFLFSAGVAIHWLIVRGWVLSVPTADKSVWTSLVYVGIFALITISFCLVVLLVAVIQDRSSFRSSPKRSPGVFRSWLRAKKEKVCPIIKITD